MAATTPQPTELELDPKYDHYDFPTTSIEGREGHPGFLTAPQQAQVHQLRLMLESEGFTDHLDTLTLLRFLRARKFDVAAAKKMLVEHEQWRNAVTILEQEDTATKGKPRLLSLHDENPLKNPPAQPIKLDEAVRTWDKDGSFKRELSNYYTQFYHKTDKDGRPLYFEKLGGVDFAKLKEKKYTNDKMILNLAVEYEKMVDPRLPACSRQAGRLVETSCSILDVAGVSVWRPGKIYEYVSQTSAMSGNNYPERMGKMYIINVGTLHWAAWKIIKGFLDPVTASKINVLTSSEYKAELLKQIPAENLPASFGGSCQCAGGCELSDAGPWHDQQWARPAWWQKDPAQLEAEKAERAAAAAKAPAAEDSTIENKPSEIVSGTGATTEAEIPAVEEARATA